MLPKLCFIVFFVTFSPVIYCAVVNLNNSFKQWIVENKCVLPKGVQLPIIGEKKDSFFGIPLSFCNNDAQSGDSTGYTLCHEMFENLLKILKCGRNEPVFNDEMLKEISYNEDGDVCEKLKNLGKYPPTIFANVLQDQKSCFEICSLHKEPCDFLLWAYQLRNAIRSNALESQEENPPLFQNFNMPELSPDAKLGLTLYNSTKSKEISETVSKIEDPDKSAFRRPGKELNQLLAHNTIMDKSAADPNDMSSGKKYSDHGLAVSIANNYSKQESSLLVNSDDALQESDKINEEKLHDNVSSSQHMVHILGTALQFTTSSKPNEDRNSNVGIELPAIQVKSTVMKAKTPKAMSKVPTNVVSEAHNEDVMNDNPSSEKEKKVSHISKSTDQNSISSNSEKASDLDATSNGNIGKGLDPMQNSPDFSSLAIDNEVSANSHFFLYFVIVVGISLGCYGLFHNKQKIIALIVEGRHERRRRHNGASYRKLETKT